MSSAERFSKVERLKRELSIAEHEEQIEQIRSELGEEPRPIVEEVEEPKLVVKKEPEYLHVEEQQMRKVELKQEDMNVLAAANASLQQPLKGNKRKKQNEKRENVYREHIPMMNEFPRQRTSFDWLMGEDVLKWMQKSELNCFKHSLPVNELSQLYCRDIQHEWSPGLRDRVRRNLAQFEKDGLVEKRNAYKTKVSAPLLPKEVKENDDDSPVVLKYKTFGVNANFWYLTKKGLKA